MSVTVIYAGQKHRHSLVIKLKWIWLFLVLFGLIGALAGWRIYNGYSATLMQYKAATLSETRKSEQLEIEAIRQQSEQQLVMLAGKLGSLQAQVNRLNALGGRLVREADLEEGEFDFTKQPPMGGPVTAEVARGVELETLDKELNILATELKDREQQMLLLESLLLNHHISEDTAVLGMPIKGNKAWLSSPFGFRKDPFNGRSTFHKGVDIASANGTKIVATAAGVVSWAGHRSGYGKLVEINHGNGYVTRYAHAKQVTVKEGEVVSRGDTVALMGTTGRSTGPHVHYEVIKDGRQVNPRQYLYRKAG